MGKQISMVRETISTSEEQKHKNQERLLILERMIKYQLDNAKSTMLNGEKNDQQIHDGTVVQFYKQIYIKVSNSATSGTGSQSKSTPTDKDKPGQIKSQNNDDSATEANLGKAINSFFGGNIKKGFQNLVQVGVSAILGNSFMGEHEDTKMFIMWSDNSLIRLDAYIYRWNFSCNEIIQNIEGATGVLVMKRVLDITTVDPQVLTWAITSQSSDASQRQEAIESADEMIESATKVIKKINDLREVIRPSTLKLPEPKKKAIAS